MVEEMKLLINLHKKNERQGPGSTKDTLRAFELTGINPKTEIKIADIGCGTGSQTLTLANNCNCKIKAVDLFPEFLSKLDEKSSVLGLKNKISTINCSMDNLIFEQNEFDLIWSEGAIYNMGFENGINYWKKFLKTGGCIAISEISWITESRPLEIENYWIKEYPEIDTVSNKIKVLEHNGYSHFAHFVLPSYCWIEKFYKPLQDSFENFLKENNYSELAKNIVDNEKKEILFYEKYKEYYSYGFYIALKK